MKRLLLALLAAAALGVPTLPVFGSGIPRDSLPKNSAAQQTAAAEEAPEPVRQRFLPTRRRMDREIDKIKYAYRGEIMLGTTASYGTLSTDEADIWTLVSNITAEGAVASVKPFVGYFYRDNRCIGVRFGYQHMSGKIQNAEYDLGASNNISGAIPYFDMKSNSYSFGLFHRSYAGLDPAGRIGLFAELTTLDALRRAASLTGERLYHEHVTIYLYTHPETFSVELLPLPAELEHRQDLRFTLDTSDDFTLLSNLYADWYEGTDRSLPALLQTVDARPEYLARMKENIKRNEK